MKNVRQSGVTLIELVIAIVIIAIAATAILGTFATTVGQSADPMIRHQAVAIAEAYLEEISLKSFDDPDGIDGEATRDLYDDVDDYDGLTDNGARNQFDAAIAELSDYTIDVSVTGSNALPSITSADLVLINVTVTHPENIDFTVSGYRANY
ncbi:MAG: prepilin-type N-terminal cleavage/methylation domain-containing protein [Woeseiaceae bacterium]|nr:prepilin-type N-terminal cleavage/methylation domain-containing protein [Woeseiaceae bacterium]